MFDTHGALVMLSVVPLRTILVTKHSWCSSYNPKEHSRSGSSEIKAIKISLNILKYPKRPP